MVIAAVAVVAVAIVISSSGGSSSPVAFRPGPRRTRRPSSVETLLTGIPQNGNTLGNPNAPVTVTEFGDLECPICKDFALGAENTADRQRGPRGQGQARLPLARDRHRQRPGPRRVPHPAGRRARRRPPEARVGTTSSSSTTSRARRTRATSPTATWTASPSQIPGLNFTTWNSDRASSSLTAQVTQDEQAAAAKGYNSTPTLVVSGPKGQAQAIVGDTDYGSLQSAIKSVS